MTCLKLRTGVIKDQRIRSLSWPNMPRFKEDILIADPEQIGDIPVPKKYITEGFDPTLDLPNKVTSKHLCRHLGAGASK